MHNAGFAAATWFDKITRGQNDAASPSEHNRGVWMLHGCFNNDASAFGKVISPGSIKLINVSLKTFQNVSNKQFFLNIMYFFIFLILYILCTLYIFEI